MNDIVIIGNGGLAKEIAEYIENNPDVDISEYSQMYIYTPLIVMSLIEKIKNKYGFKKQKNILKG